MLLFTDDQLKVLRSDTQRCGVFFWMKPRTGPTIRLWLGIGNVIARISAVDPNGAIYKGAGILQSVPELQSLINGTAERVSFMVSGISDKTFNKASEEKDDVKRAPMQIGLGVMSSDWQLIGAPVWVWRGWGDVLTLGQNGQQNEINRTIELSAVSLFSRRRRRSLSYLTDRDQQERHPGDRMCERTILYSQGVNKVWPKF